MLGALAPCKALASDVYRPLIEIWNQLKTDPAALAAWYAERYALIATMGKPAAYEAVKQSFNCSPNGADFVFLTRTCYGGVVRFRKQDGQMSTPCGVHDPISPSAFARRVEEWRPLAAPVNFVCCGFDEAMDQAREGDLVYCDPPYPNSQSIVYGAQSFRLGELVAAIERCKERGVYVALSLDGTKKSGAWEGRYAFPKGLFEREISVSVGKSMLRRFQMEGRTLESEHVTDQLLLTF